MMNKNVWLVSHNFGFVSPNYS